MAPTVADQMVEVLIAAGVKRVYGVVGDSLNGFTDALRRAWRRSNGCTSATKRSPLSPPAPTPMSLATSPSAPAAAAPATCTLSTASSTASARACRWWRSRRKSPRPRSARIISRRRIPSGCSRNARAIASWSSTPEQMPRVLEIAVRRSILERCVSVVVDPRRRGAETCCSGACAKGAQGSRLLNPRSRRPTRRSTRSRNFSIRAERVTLLCGGGCAGAHAELMQFAEAVKAPIVHAMRGKEHVEWDNPYDVGMTGLIGFSSGYYAMEYCDALLMLGTDFPYRQFYPTEARIAQVDIRPQAIGRRAPVDLGIVGDVGADAQRAPAAAQGQDRPASSGHGADALRQRAQGARRARDRPAGRRPASAADLRVDQRAGRRRRDLHLPTSACRPYGPRAISP